MTEMKDIENEHLHIDVIMAKEKFKMFAFKWRILCKVNKMKLLDRDSHEFTKASLEVQELVKNDIDSKVAFATSTLRERMSRAK